MIDRHEYTNISQTVLVNYLGKVSRLGAQLHHSCIRLIRYNVGSEIHYRASEFYFSHAYRSLGSAIYPMLSLPKLSLHFYDYFHTSPSASDSVPRMFDIFHGCLEIAQVVLLFAMRGGCAGLSLLGCNLII
jgi:hypothetical protein